MKLGLDVYTTGQISKMLGVAPRTVSKWIDEGTLKGYRIKNLASQGDRRVRKADLLAYLNKSGIPVPQELLSYNLLLSADTSLEVDGFRRTDTPFDLGLVVAEGRAEYVVAVDVGSYGKTASLALSRALAMRADRAMLIALLPDDEPASADWAAFHHLVNAPFAQNLEKLLCQSQR